MAQELPVAGYLQHFKGRMAPDLTPAEGRYMDKRIAAQEASMFFLVNGCRDRVYAAAHSLSEDDHVRHDAELLEAPQRARSAETGLNLVHDQEGPP